MARLDGSGTVLARAFLGHTKSVRPFVGLTVNTAAYADGAETHSQPPKIRSTVAPALSWYRGKYHLTDTRTQWPLTFVVGQNDRLYSLNEAVHYRWSADLEPERVFVSGAVDTHGRPPTPPFSSGENLVSWHAVSPGSDSAVDSGRYLVFGPDGLPIDQIEGGRVTGSLEQFVPLDGRVHMATSLGRLSSSGRLTVAALRPDLTAGPEVSIATNASIMVALGGELALATPVGPGLAGANRVVDQIHLRSILPGDGEAAGIDLTNAPRDVTGRTHTIGGFPWEISFMAAGDKLALIWVGREPDNANRMVFFRTFDARLRPLQPVTRLTPLEASVVHAHMVWDGQSFALVWSDDRREGRILPDIYFAHGRADCK